MRLLVISHSSVLGAYQAKLARLAQDGFEVHLAAPSWWPEASPRRAFEQPFPQLHYHTLPTLLTGRLSRFVYFGLGSLMRRVRPDIVFAEEEHFLPSGWQCMHAAKKAGICFGFYTWENIRSHFRQPLDALASQVLKHSDFAVVGNIEAAALLRMRRWDRPMLVMPQYGVDPEVFRPVAKPADHAFTVGYLGRLVPEKGVGDLLQAFAALPKGACLQLAGHGPLIALAKGRAGVEALGGLAYPEVPHFLQNLDVLVLPSRTTPVWKEQFGRVLAEAMACGVPCVGSDSGAIPEVIGPGGLVYPEGDAKALAQCLLKFWQQPALYHEKAQAARQRALALYTHDHLGQMLGAFLKQQVAAHPRK
jgi:glycosyltransferase involved in cell wall biosynthesis